MCSGHLFRKIGLVFPHTKYENKMKRDTASFSISRIESLPSLGQIPERWVTLAAIVARSHLRNTVEDQ